MKHIGAILGPPENYYNKKFAWIPTRLKNGSYVWLTDYMEKETTWRWYKGAPVLYKINISMHEAMLEGLKEINHKRYHTKSHYQAWEDDYMGRD
jgi:hypothetical protein